MEQRMQFKVTNDIVASIGKRFLNYLIDVILQVILLFFFAIVTCIIADLWGSKKALDFFSKLDKNTIGLYTVTFSVILIYYNVFEILFARTIGKFLTQTVVVDSNGEKPNSETILMRSLCRLIPFNPLSVLINPGRAWHDSLSKTYVVDKRMLEEAKRKFHAFQVTTAEE